ncbi:MAG: hypothetical protein WA254_19580 [Candidatus Sulfotelmatobacter sp.]
MAQQDRSDALRMSYLQFLLGRCAYSLAVMRIAWLIIAFAALMASGQESKPHSDARPRNSAAKNTDAPDTAGQTVVVVNQQAPQRQENDHSSKPPNWYTTSAPAEWALFLAGTVGVIVALSTLKAINRQVGEMARQGQLMFEQIKAMREQVTEMSVQTAILDRSVAAAKQSADAAKISSDIVAKVSIPTLKVSEFTIDAVNLSNLAFFRRPKFKITVKNWGQTPAFLWSWTIKMTCEDLPDIPTYEGIASGMPLEKQAIPGGDSFTLPEVGFHRQYDFSVDDATAVTEQKKNFWVYGYVVYGDIFGNPLLTCPPFLVQG